MSDEIQQLEQAIQQLEQAIETARTARKKGDALRGRRLEDVVFVAYEVGIKALEGSLESVSEARTRLSAGAPPATGKSAYFLSTLVEAYGALGGLRQRVNRLGEALDSYSAGAELEEKFGLAGTYNRLNRLKQTLLTRRDVPLLVMEPQIKALAEQIEKSLRSDQSLSDSGWAWADLGDCLALLGRADEAERAYATFIGKAETKSPERALDVLKQIVAELLARNDPGAGRVQTAIDTLKKRLVSS